MAPRSFLSLPWELRHGIYRFYFPTKQGYHFSPASGKLTAADGKPIDLALMYTCRLIAEETKEMPLLYNDICFKTFYQKDLSLWLGRFDRLVEAQFLHQLQLLVQLCPFITPEMHLRIGERFPWFSTHLRSAFVFRWGPEWLSRSWGSAWGMRPLQVAAMPPSNYLYQQICSNDQAHSAHRAAIEFTLRLLCETSDEQFIEDVNDMLVDWEYSGGTRLSNFLNRCYKPWRFPLSLCDLDEMGRRLGYGKGWASINWWEASGPHGLQYRRLYRFSAVSAAIGFLDDLPINKRASLHNIIIHEDRVSEGYPDGHAIGLIPFCQENRRLRIRHKFSVVSNLLERAYFYGGCLDEIQEFKSDPNDIALLSLAAIDLYPIVSNCLAEAMHLPDAGMPDGSYTLVLDGEDAEDMCSEIFQKEVLRQEAKRLVISRALKAAPDSDWAHEMSFEIKQAPKAHAGALEHLVNKTSFFELNFYPGHLNNVDALMAHYHRIGMKACVEELYWDRSHDHVLTGFSHAHDFTSMLMENFECRKVMTPESTYHGIDSAETDCDKVGVRNGHPSL
ncbi:uncharacterized protein FFB20_12008 [Fusarium fujikuroi]|nr:uncharacterized protein FFE2_07366 [Fusarium fujikuroi]SCO03834.1 uncharacterized protein FFB20_12008 [Fusarium fujikuroi]VZH91450.1 unnamed protein product [Fusarium fujikuroi]